MLRDRLWRAVLIGAAAIAIGLQLPAIVGDARAAFSLARIWVQPDEQYRLVLGEVPYDLLIAADARLPRDATVLLVTPGTDVRHREYEAFHRALYFLTPRPVHWINPAPGDGTWEARWWTTAPIWPVSICAEAERFGATHVVLIDVEVPSPPCATVGTEVQELSGGALVGPGVATIEQVGAEPAPARVALGALAALAIPLALGSATVAYSARRSGLHVAQRAAAAWVIGTGAVTLADIALGALGVDAPARLAALATAAVLAAVALGARWSARGAARNVTFQRPRLPEIVLFGGVASLVALVALLAIGRPLSIWDGWAIWAMKARTIFLEGHVTEAVFADPTRASAHLAYPLHLPVLESWLFNWVGAPDDRLVGLLSVATFAALLAVVYGTMRRWGASTGVSLVSVVVLGSLVHLWRISAAGLADVPIALLMTVACVLLVEWLDGGRRGVLVLAAISAGLLPWTKMEGAVLLVVLAGLLAARGIGGITPGMPNVRSRAFVSAAACLLGGLVLSGGWWAVVVANGLLGAEYQPSLGTFIANADRLPTIVSMELQMLADQAWSYLWPVAAAVFVYWALTRARRHRAAEPGLLPASAWVLPAAAGLYLAAMSAAYVVTTFVPYTEQIESSAFRLALHVLPITVIWAVAALDELTRSSRAPIGSGQSSSPAPREAG